MRAVRFEEFHLLYRFEALTVISFSCFSVATVAQMCVCIVYIYRLPFQRSHVRAHLKMRAFVNKHLV